MRQRAYQDVRVLSGMRHSHLYHLIGNGMSIKAGTLDDTSWLKPDAHYWTSRRQSWVVVPDGVAQFSDDG